MKDPRSDVGENGEKGKAERKTRGSRWKERWGRQWTEVRHDEMMCA